MRDTTSPLAGVGAERPETIGRRVEIEQLTAILATAAGGDGRCAVIAGEPGIGKSQLLGDAAAHARVLGLLPVWGRSWDGGGAPPFWPWTQILRDAVAAVPSAAAALGAARPLLELDAATDDIGPGAERTRFLLYDGVNRFLHWLSARQPILLLLDDMHAADPDSISLLRFVVRDLRERRICACIASRRAVGNSPRLDDLGHAALRIDLRGLDASDTEALARRTMEETGAAIDTDALPGAFLAALQHSTGGNPLFVRETVRELALHGDAWTVPANPAGLPISARVREAILARLVPLAADTRRGLQIAAVTGLEWDLRVVRAAMAEASGGASTAWTDEARRQGLIERAPDGDSRFVFAHALVREVLYDSSPADERERWHARVARALEAIFADQLPAHSAAIAHHKCRAGAAVEAAEALRAVVRAARHSERAMAYAAAVEHWQRAMEMSAGAAGRDGGPADGEVLLGLGGALNLAGDRRRARSVLERAMEAARAAGDADAFAHAVLAYGGETIGTMEVAKVTAGPGAVFDDRLVALLREALERLGEGADALQARLLSRLAVELYFTAPMSERTELAGRALALARQGGEPQALGHVLCETLVAVWGPESGEARLRWSREVVCLGQRHGHASLEAAGRAYAVNTLLELGDTHALRAEAAAFERLAERCPLPLLRWQVEVYRGMRALIDGRLEEAEALASAALQLGRNDNASLAFTVQTMELRRRQGRLGELGESIGLFKAIADQYPTMLYIRAALAHLLVGVGDMEEARRQFEAAVADDCAGLVRDITWIPAMTRLADVCVALDDRRVAARLYALLTPWAHANSLGTYGSVCWGSVARELGCLAASMELWDESADWFRLAARRNQELAARALVAETQLDHAAMLRRRCEGGGDHVPGIAAEALSLVRAAAATAEVRALAALRTRAADLAATLTPLLRPPRPAIPAPAPISPDNPPALEPTFLREGEYWSISDGCRTVRLKDHRGLRCLAQLVRQPGREIHALELLRLSRAESAGGSPGAGALAELAIRRRDGDGDLGSLIDPQAKAAYRRRVEELRAELEQAQAASAGERAAALQEELDAVARELSRAVGLGGRLRRQGTGAERARVNVTRAVHAALKRISAVHPALGSALERAVRTGTFCSYRGAQGRVRPSAC